MNREAMVVGAHGRSIPAIEPPQKRPTIDSKQAMINEVIIQLTLDPAKCQLVECTHHQFEGRPQIQ